MEAKKTTFKEQLSIVANPELYGYLLQHSLREGEVQRKLREEIIVPHPKANYSSTPDESQFLAFLVETLNAKRVIEVGVFMGYTTLTLALALPADGKIVALDISEEVCVLGTMKLIFLFKFTAEGKKAWEEAGVSHKVDLRLGSAVETLQSLVNNGEEGTYDFAYIDCNKSDYDSYYELCLKLLRVGGIIAVDNVLWHGKVMAPKVRCFPNPLVSCN